MSSEKADPVGSHTSEVEVEDEWTPPIDADDAAVLERVKNDPNGIVETRIRGPERLGYISVVFLILNRCIGTGVFNSASVVTANTQSLGLSVILWFCGCLFALAGMQLYIELGLTLPRWSWHGVEESTPCSGGELNYLNYIVKIPKYLTTCVFGISFIVWANTGANSIAFGQNILDAAGRTPTVGAVCAIAIAGNTFACILHGMSRKWGIWLNNLLGFSKLAILLFLIIIGFAAAAQSPQTSSNLTPPKAFARRESTSLPFRYAEAFLFVIFPFGGFHQANYVLAEIDQPKKKFKRASRFAVCLVCVLFMLVNIAYMLVVSSEEQFQGIDIGERFFTVAMDKLAGTDPERANRVFAGLKAVSSLGNIIVVTFTAARVKQEIAKEGILPFSLVFAENYDVSLGRLLGRHKPSPSPSESKFIIKTPVATLILHWVLTTIIVLAATLSLRPVPYENIPAYTFVVAVYAFVIDVIFFLCVGLGVLYLRLAPWTNWRKISEVSHSRRFFQPQHWVHHWVSIFCALIFTAALIFPFICMWIPDPAKPFIQRTDSLLAWYVPQTVGVVVVATGFLYYLGFRFILPHFGDRGGKELVIERYPIFHREHGYRVQLYETILFSWKVKERD